MGERGAPFIERHNHSLYKTSRSFHMIMRRSFDWGLVTKLATPISNGGLFGTPPGFCTDTCLWQV